MTPNFITLHSHTRNNSGIRVGSSQVRLNVAQIDTYGILSDDDGFTTVLGKSGACLHVEETPEQIDSMIEELAGCIVASPNDGLSE